MKKNLIPLHLKSRIITKIFMVIILSSFASGCFHEKAGIVKIVTNVNHLREAQVAFNEAATIENESRMGALDPLTRKVMKAEIDKTVAVQSGYASALISLNKIYPSEKEQLKSDKILSQILFLKAMAQWRIGDFENALVTADEAKQEAEDQRYPRDAAILTALPGLIKIDLAHSRIETMEEGKTAENKKILNSEIRPRLVAQESGAVYDINLARKKVNKKHEVNIYLIQNQLSAYRNYQVAYQLANKAQSPPDTDKAKEEAKYNLQDLLDVLDVLKISRSKNLVDYWKYLCTIKPKKRQ